MKTTHLAVLSCVAATELIFGNNAALAQTSVDPSHLQSLDDADGTSPGPGNANKITAQASNETPKATGRLRGTFPWINDLALEGSVLANTPLNGSSSPKPDIGSVSNLTAGVNARLDGGVLYWPATPRSTTDREETICDDYVKSIFDSRFFWKLPVSMPTNGILYFVQGYDEGASCDMLASSPALVKKAALNLNAEIAAYNKAHKSDPGHKDENPVVLNTRFAELGKVAHERLVQLNYEGWKTAQRFGFSLLGNQQNISYALPQSPIMIQKKKAEGYGIAANYSAIFNSSVLSIALSYERPYKSGSGTQICKPITGTTGQTCDSASLGAPVRTTQRIATVEYRAIITPGIAVSPRLEYDTVSSNFGINVPVYFVTDAKKLFTSGLMFGYTKDAGFQGGVVITKAFAFE